MAAKIVEFSNTVREKILKGVERISDAVIVTLGPKGRNVAIEKSYGAPRLTKDGVSVAKEVELSDHFENIGASLIKEIASKTGDNVGDGTTTATVLAKAITKNGIKHVVAGANPMDLKRGIDIAVQKVLAKLDSMSKKIDSYDEISQVATVSANGDKEIGNLIADAVLKVGKTGVITVEEAKAFKTELTVVEGMQFDRGYISPYFINNNEKMTVELENPYILIYDKKISSIQTIIPILESVARSGKSLLIIAEDVDADALAGLVINKLRGVLKVAAVKAPGFGDRRKAMLEDLAILTGGQLISEELGYKLENTTIDMFGTAGRVVITKEHTTVINGAGDKASIDSRCVQINEQISSTTSEYDKEKLQERLAKLSNGVAIIKVGGATETEMKERKDRVDDSVCATKAAVDEGIVAGGGSALVFAATVLDSVKLDSPDQMAGIKIVKDALISPITQIALNAGYDGSYVARKVIDSNNEQYGFDARNGVYGNMIDLGIVDPLKVVKMALVNSTSIASLLITTEAGIVNAPEKNKPMPMDPSQMGGMGGMGGMPMGM